MDKQQIFEKIKMVFEEFFGEEIVLTPETAMENLEAWDSVAHIQVIFALEEEFGIQFDSERIFQLNSIAQLLKELEQNEHIK